MPLLNSLTVRPNGVNKAMSFKIKNRWIGDGHGAYITFEAGPTISDLESALSLTQAAAEAGADAIKFQIFDVDKLVSDKQQPFSYDILIDRETGESKTVSEPLYDILKRRCLANEEWQLVKQKADELGLAFFATVGFVEDIEFLVKLGCDSIKIASADVNHFPLLREAAKTGLCIQIDTGNATIGEIEAAVELIRSENNDRIIIHQCPSGYPAHLESIHLNMIPTLKTLFGVPVAFSDHTPGWDMDIAAVALGANLLEKTITLDRTTPSVEHIMSIEPSDMRAFLQAVRDLETALGSSLRSLTQEQIENRRAIRRSAFYKHDLAKGHVLCAADIEYRRPGYGIEPSDYRRLEGATLQVGVKGGQMVSWQQIAGEVPG